MSEVSVHFGVTPYEYAIRKGFQYCFAISTMQIGDENILTLESRPVVHKAPTSTISTWLPEGTARNVYDFLYLHDLFERQKESDGLDHANCHMAAEVGPGWVEPDDIDPNLLYSHMLEADEVVPVDWSQIPNLGAGQVYTFPAKADDVDWPLFPTHSILGLPKPDLHFSKLGLGGVPYIGSNKGALNYYKGEPTRFFQTTTKPRELGTNKWYLQAAAEDLTFAADLAQDFRKAQRIMKGLRALRSNLQGALV